MREIVTLQLGPQASWVGAHFWNFQDDSLHPEVAEDGSVVEDPNAADVNVLYRGAGGQAPDSEAERGGRGAAAVRTPRLVICDRSEGFGSLGAQGRSVPTAGTSAPAGGDLPPVDALSWGAGVNTIVMEAHAPSPFVRSLYDEHDSEGEEWDEEEEEHHEDADQAEDEEDSHASRERRHGASAAAPSRALSQASAGIKRMRVAGEGAAATPAAAAPASAAAAPAPAASFNFESTVQYWSDYLQAQLHTRSVAPLRAHTHGFSELDLWAVGEEVMKREEAALDNDSPALMDRVRRFLEECDSPQGIHLLADVDGSFGGLGHAVLTRIRDEMTSAPCLVLGFGTTPLAASDPEAAPYQACVSALNDALALTSFGELRTLYTPMPGHEADVELRYPPVCRVDEALRYHTSALPATWLDAATLPFRTVGTSRGGLARLLGGLQAAPRFNLAAAVLGLPLPPPALGAPDIAGRRAWAIPSGGVFTVKSFLCPLSPWALPPSQAHAFAQSVSVLGFPPDPMAVVATLPRLLPCPNANTSIFTREAPLALPLPFPQFFTPDLGTAGQLLPPARNGCPRKFRPRAQGDEVMSVPTTAAVQSTPALGPLVSVVTATWLEQKRVVAHRLAAHYGPDELTELTEELLCLKDAYNPKRGGEYSESEEEEEEG